MFRSSPMRKGEPIFTHCRQLWLHFSFTGASTDGSAVSWTVTRPGSSLTPHLDPQRPPWPSVTTSQVLWAGKFQSPWLRVQEIWSRLCVAAKHWLSCIIGSRVTSSQHLNLISCPASNPFNKEISDPDWITLKENVRWSKLRTPQECQRMATKLNHQIPNIEANKIDLHSPC